MHSITPRSGVPCGEWLTVEPLGAVDVGRPPHRHDFAQLAFIEAGGGDHLIDFAPVPIAAGEVHVLAPGQVHSWEASGLRGFALMFSEDLLDELGELPDQLRELTLLGAAPIRLTVDAQRRVRRLIDAIADTHSEESGRHLVTAALWECIEGGSAAPAAPEHSTLSRSFLRLVLRAPSARMTVSSCAAALNVTSGHLTESVVADTGTTPGQVLRTAMAREAQRLLSGTELSAAQISARLGFSEPSYFSRFFRREVGCTPTEYRELPPTIRRQR
ncbi:MAG: AraC family transcriptional regulator [Actinobacteria bacterium]|nr:AraC family transcriptional regulator [Actinomycetota bacterium]